MNYLLLALVALLTLVHTAAGWPALSSLSAIPVNNVPKDYSVNGSKRHKNCRYRNGLPNRQSPFDYACRVDNSPQHVTEQTHENNHKDEASS